MRLSTALLLISLAGVLGGAWLIGFPVFGGAVIFDSLCVGVFALMRDDGLPGSQPQVHGAPTLSQVLERARDAS